MSLDMEEVVSVVPQEKQNKRAYGLSREQIRNLIDNNKKNPHQEERDLRAKAEDEEIPHTDLLKANKELANFYARRYLDEYLQVIDSSEVWWAENKGWAEEDAFMRALAEIREESPYWTWDHLSTRIMKSEVISLYYLLIGGQLDKMVSKVKEKEGLVLDEGEELKLKVDLAVDFLDGLQRKNKEIKMANASYSPVTFGLEIEFSQVLHYLMLEVTELNTKQAKGGELSKRERQKLELYYNYQDKKMSADLFDSDNDKNVPFMPVFSPLFENEVTVIKPMYRGRVMEEVAFKPSATPRLQLREIIELIHVGGLEGSGGFHFTIGGVELSPQHLEVMLIPLMLMAANLMYVPEEKIEKRKEAISKGRKILRIKESYSKQGAGHITYPYLKRRGYETKNYPAGGQGGGVAAVEFRSLYKFRRQDFPKLVKTATFMYLSGWMINGQQALDRGEEADDLNTKLSGEWKEMKAEWRDFLEKNGFKDPMLRVENGESANGIMFDAYADGATATEYEKLMLALQMRSLDDEEFRRGAYEIVKKYTHRTKKIVGY